MQQHCLHAPFLLGFFIKGEYVGSHPYALFHDFFPFSSCVVPHRKVSRVGGLPSSLPGWLGWKKKEALQTKNRILQGQMLPPLISYLS